MLRFITDFSSLFPCLLPSAQATTATRVLLDSFSRDLALHSVTSGSDLTLTVGLINDSQLIWNWARLL